MGKGLKLINIIIMVLAFFEVKANDDSRTFETMNAANGLADNSAQTIVCTKTGRMIITTLGNVNFYDGVSFSHIDTDQKYEYGLVNYRGNYHLYFDKHHHIWLKNTGKTTCVNLTTEHFVTNVQEVFTEFGINRTVDDLFVDDNGHLWLMLGDSISNIDTHKSYPVFPDKNLQDLNVKDDYLYLFYEDGEMAVYHLETAKLAMRSRAYGEDMAQGYDRSSLIVPCNEGFFQIRNGDKGGILMQYDVKRRQWSALLQTPYHLNGLLLYNGKGYMACEYGYWHFDLKSKEFTHVEGLQLQGGGTLNTDINVLAFDKQGGMWIGTENRGLLYSKPVGALFHPLTWQNPLAHQYAAVMDQKENAAISGFNGKSANTMLIDSRGWTWFGTTTGLYLFKKPHDEPIVFNRQYGLLNNVIHSLIEDDDHNIWVSTSFGVTALMVEDDDVVFVNSFNLLEEMPNESFVNGRVLKLDDGTIVMQALDHVLTFQPKDFELLNRARKTDLTELYPKLIRLVVNGNSIYTGEEYNGRVILEKAVSRTKEINLNANENTVSLRFSALNYYRPLQTYYRVRIKEIEDTWKVYSYYDSDGMVDSNGILHLLLLGLKPGTYTVEVQASMFPNLWENEPYEWIVRINQPWWQTTGVLVFMGLILLGLLFVNFMLYNRNTRMRIQRRSEEGGVVKRLVTFVEKCEEYRDDVLQPRREEVYGEETNQQSGLSSEFVDLMLEVEPYVQESRSKDITLHKLCEVTEMDIEELYKVITANIYKNPRMMVRMSRLQDAADLLETTQMTIEEISNKCKFSTPNFFIACFYHNYKMTPEAYRKSVR